MVAQVLEDTTDDTVTTRVDLDTYLAQVLFADVAKCISMDLTILELNTLSDAAAYPPQTRAYPAMRGRSSSS